MYMHVFYLCQVVTLKMLMWPLVKFVLYTSYVHNSIKYSINDDGFAISAFDPFGAGPMPKSQDMMGSFLGPGNMGQPDPFLHAARSPSPTLQPTSLGKACHCCSAAHSPSTLGLGKKRYVRL